MKCQKCNNPAIFHITEMIGNDRTELHLCDHHASEYLHKNDPKGGASEDDASLSKMGSQLQETTSELIDLDYVTCPICGFSYQDYRKTTRLGCPHDYTFFQEQIDPVLEGIHGAMEHIGKRPARMGGPSQRIQLIRLRRELDEAVSIEDYERAGQLRDQIRELEKQ